MEGVGGFEMRWANHFERGVPGGSCPDAFIKGFDYQFATGFLVI